MAVVIVWLVITAAVLAAALVGWRLGWERYRPRPTGTAVPTDEVLVDPETGRRQRVHMDPVTGTRAYVDDPPPPSSGPAAHR